MELCSKNIQGVNNYSSNNGNPSQCLYFICDGEDSD